MGRGRAKAKQTKVARELKYFSPDTDLSALERELHGSSSRYEPEPDSAAEEEDEWDPAAGRSPDDGTYAEYGKWASGEG